MRKFDSAALVGAALALVISSASVHGQATRTWVSGVGDDANPCSRTAPCKTFAGAISKTAAGGEISVLDPGGFGAVTITKSISITNDNSGEAGILASLVNGITVNAGAADIVQIRGLVIEGATNGLNGIRFLAGGALHVQNCVIRNFRSANSFGISIAPASGTTEVFVNNSVIADNGNPSTGGGVQIRPTGTATVRGVLSRVAVNNNTSGIFVDGGATSGQIHLTVSDSVTGGSLFSGIAGVSAGATARVVIERTVSASNTTGINSVGTGAVVILGSSTVTGNTTGLAFSGNGSLFSYQDNNVNGNLTTDGTPSATLTKR
jgi:hypothetical protein